MTRAPEVTTIREDAGMHLTAHQEWRDHVIVVRDIDTPGERSEFFLRARRGEFTRIFRGVHIRTSIWETMGVDERHRAMVQAAAAWAEEELVFSHASAVGLWRLPWIGAWPHYAHLTVGRAAGGRSNRMFVRHTTGEPDNTLTIDGVTVASLARTVVDVARTEPFARAVTVADAALRRTTHPHPDVPETFLTRQNLVRELKDVPIRHGVRKAERVIQFADGRADRPGESMSRVGMHMMRLPAPELQVVLSGASGREWTVDFFWPRVNLVGEFDGEAKYSEQQFLRGRSSAQAVIEEKAREDDLRAAGFGVSRWGWRLAMSPAALRAYLVKAGLR